MSNSSSRYDEIPTTTGGKLKFVCGPHQNVFCNNCMMDFGLMNEARYDNSIDVSNIEVKVTSMSSAIDAFYRKSKRNNMPSRSPSPRAMPLMESMNVASSSSSSSSSSSDSSIEVNAIIELLSYFTFTSHGTPLARPRLESLLSMLVKSLRKEEEDRSRATKDLEYQKIKKEQKRETKARRKAGRDNHES